MQKLKKDDLVIITAGKDRGKRAKIERFVGKTSVLLPGLNIFKRHWKKRSEKDQGGIREVPRPVPIGNVALICPKCGKPTRVGWKIDKDQRLRICRKCNKTI
ncbi:50S ribosomal protein L24 [Candidatus Gottesmanbacteria bacterium]|nr:50S ribosomal protein L24 [Candidatus Gottesmanbacteria bacterium]